MHAEVIIARRMPLRLPFLDYEIPAELERTARVGQLVKVPLRGSAQIGVIKKITAGTSTQKNSKPLSEIVCERPFLSPEQLDFLAEISKFYLTPLTFLLKTNLPPFTKKKLAALKDSARPEQSPSRSFTKPCLHTFGTTEQKAEIYKEIIPKQGQVLIVVPEVADVPALLASLPASAEAETVVITSDVSVKNYFINWMKIWRGEARIVVGTRSAIFLPWHDLRCIVLDDEANANHKSWDMAPRYHARDALTFLAKHHRAKLHFVCHTPSVESYFFSTKGIYESFDTGRLAKKIPISIINLKDERKSGNESFLGIDLINQIQCAEGDVFLYANRLGSASYMICQDCSEVIKCPNCQKALSLVGLEKEMRCAHCQYKTNLKITCPACGGINLKAKGVGTETVEAEAKRLFGRSRQIVRVDSETGGEESLESPGYKIFIGTDKIWSRLKWDRLKLMAFVDADSSLFIPEFKIAEDLFYRMSDAVYRLPDGAQLFVQTSRPEHYIFQSLYRPELFYDEELKERKMLGYPPFNYLVRFYFGDFEAKKAYSEGFRTFGKLSALTKEGFRGKLYGPMEMTPYNYKGKYWQMILAKVPYVSYKHDTKLIASRLSEGWKFDPNPNTILYH